ncbi:MAG: hypothetical protein MUP98_03790 [Candidatus Aminicenantes bacterium]|nr:hypothetical protein [Candidatus Aminicenantes bacterium]
MIYAEIRVIGDLTHTQNAQPGETYETRIVIKNFGDQETGIKVYQRDFSYNSEASQFFYEIGTQKRSNAGWITYSPLQGKIFPFETTEILCSIHAPEDKTLVGTFWSLIIIESSFAKRYAIQIITHIGLTGTVQVEFVNTELVREKESISLHVDVKNTGERLISPLLYVEFYDEEGEFVSKIEGGTWRIYPDTSVRYRVDVTSLPAGVYRAMILVDNLDEHVFGTEFLLDLTSRTIQHHKGF